jgi:hypothetical protein
MLDLYNNQYDRETLKKHIYEVKLVDILKTQKIDVHFAVRYILNKKYQLHVDDNIIADDVLRLQTHITYKLLQRTLLDYDSDDDSVKNFDE